MIFGTPSLRSLILGKKYISLNRITVSKKNLIHNYSYLSSINKNIQVAPVLKSNAYGHGLIEIARVFDSINTPFLCVDSLYEAYELLKSRIKTNILIMGYVNPQNLQVKKLPFSYAVYSKKFLEEIIKFQPSAKIHLFIDTGMHREGISLDELPDVLELLKKYSSIKFEGVMSHFACADDTKNLLNKKQIEVFERSKHLVYQAGFEPKWFHIDASAGLLNNLDIKNSNMARCGISIYGIDITGNHSPLKPVLEFTTQVVQVKEVKKGESIGYDSTFIAKNDMKIGVLPVGYNDGLNRKLSNKGSVLIGDMVCPIVGRVSMNIATVDITKLTRIAIGDTVVIYSRNISPNVSIQDAAELCGVIPYELLVGLHTSTKREITD